MARWPLSVRMGIGLLLLGLVWAAGWTWWKASHIWVPLDLPISLSQGHLRTGPFRINISASYIVGIIVERDFDGARCFAGYECGGTPRAPVFSWSLSDRTGVLVRGQSDPSHASYWNLSAMGCNLGGFRAREGKYFLDLEVPQDATRFNEGAPRLVVVEDGNARDEVDADIGIAYSASVLLGAAGIWLMIRSARARRRVRQARFLKDSALTQPGPARLGTQSAYPPQIRRRVFWTPPSALVGSALIVAGFAVYAPFYHWMATRIFVAVDMPVSLARGHLTTGPFAINLNDYYQILLDTDQFRPYDARCDSALSTTWNLYKSGHVVGSSGKEPIPGIWVGYQMGPGTYDLDVEVLKDATCLNSWHPRLRIFTGTSSYDALASLLFWCCAVAVGAGLSLLALAGNRHFRALAPPVAPNGRPGTVPAHINWKGRPAKSRLLSGFPSFGFVAACVFGSLVIIFLVLQTPYTPVGLRVRLVRRGTSTQRSAGIEPLLIELRSAGRTRQPDLYIDSQPVSPKDFDALLQKEISRRPPNWPVYFEGDSSMDWGRAAEAIDRIRGLHAEVILLTHKQRQARL